MNIQSLFEPTDVSTPAGMTPQVTMDAITGIPSQGTGLMGEVYVPGSSIWNIGVVEELLAGDPQLTFIASELAYAAKHSDTTVAEFLDHDAASIVGDGSAYEMGPSAIALTGYVYIPPGEHAISVLSDDGFALSIGGVDFSEFASTRPTDATTRTSEFEGGLYEVELLYFDAGGAMTLGFAIDGLIVDESAFYQSPDDFLNPPADVPLVPVDDYHPSYFLGFSISPVYLNLD